MHEERDDQQLIEAIGQGDRTAFAVFVRRHAGGLLGFARRYLSSQADAEDVVQEALLRIWKSAPQWTAQGASPRSWLYRITYNLCIDQLRRTRPSKQSPDEHSSEMTTPAPSLEDDALQDESVAQLDRALHSLPERQRTALMLCAFEGLANKEAAATMDISVQALESLLARARRSLRQQLIEVEANDRVTSKID